MNTTIQTIRCTFPIYVMSAEFLVEYYETFEYNIRELIAK